MKRQFLIFFLIAATTTACSDTLVEGEDARTDTPSGQAPGSDPADDTDPSEADSDPDPDVDPNGAIGNGDLDPGFNADTNSDAKLPSPYKGWALTAGGSGNDWPHAVASDTDGNVFVGGSFETPFSIDGITVAPMRGAADAFLLAFDADGDLLWHEVYGSAGADAVRDIAVDDSGNVYVAGEHEGELRIEGVAKPGIAELDAHVLKFDTAGTLLWARAFGGSQRDSAQSLAVSAAGTVTVVGNYVDNLEVTPLAVDNEVQSGENDVFVASFDTITGAARWLHPMVGFGSDIGTAVAAADSGSVVVGVSTQWGLSFGSTSWSGDGSFTVGLVALDIDGNFAWHRHVTGGDGIALADLDVDDDGTIYGVGSFRGVVDFGSGPLDGIGKNFETWVAAWTATGEPLWADQVGGNLIDQGLGIAVADSRVFAVGRFSDELGLQGQFAVATGGYDIFVASYDAADGTADGLNTFGGTEDEQPGGIAFDRELGFFVAGYTRGTFEFDGSSFAAPGQQLDAFVVRAKP